MDVQLTHHNLHQSEINLNQWMWKADLLLLEASVRAPGGFSFTALHPMAFPGQ